MESDSLHEHDKSWKAFFITTLFILCTANVYAQSSDTIFSRYFRYAQNFADAYPREKVSLHLDNASYYLGDTIWFKAYVVTAEQNLPTTISKPLYSWPAVPKCRRCCNRRFAGIRRAANYSAYGWGGNGTNHFEQYLLYRLL